MQRGGREASKPAALAAHTGMAQKRQLAKRSEQEGLRVTGSREQHGPRKARARALKEEEPQCARDCQVEGKAGLRRVG